MPELKGGKPVLWMRNYEITVGPDIDRQKYGIIILTVRSAAVLSAVLFEILFRDMSGLVNSAKEAAYDSLIGLQLLPVIKRRQLRLAVLPFHGSAQQPVADMRVFRKERSVQVSADDVFVQDAFHAVLTIIPESIQDMAEGAKRF